MDAAEIKALADAIIARSKADHVEVSISSSDQRWIRFANNGVTTNGDTTNRSVSVTTHFGKRSGTASGTDNWSVASIALQLGANTITVTAEDAAGNTSTDQIVVTYSLGNQPPVATITAPADGTSVPVGTVLQYSGTATDPEDGPLSSISSTASSQRSAKRTRTAAARGSACAADAMTAGVKSWLRASAGSCAATTAPAKALRNICTCKVFAISAHDHLLNVRALCI